MLSQLDMTVEAHNLVRFRENFASRPDVVFPRPYLELTTRNVLVETLEAGVPIRRFTDAQGIWSDALASIGISSFLEMTLVHNFVVRPDVARGYAPCADRSKRRDSPLLCARPPLGSAVRSHSTPTCTQATCSFVSAASLVFRRAPYVATVVACRRV